MGRQPAENSTWEPVALLAESAALVEILYTQSNAQDWDLSSEDFRFGLARSLEKRFADASCTAERFKEYLQTLHVEDLALACACMKGSEKAWSCFVKRYRSYLRACAGAITKGCRAGVDGEVLADSLFAELFGLVDGKRGERSLFRYFHGRSSLKTWLRAILAQRLIDGLREGRRWERLDREDGEAKQLVEARRAVVQPEMDPHRKRYVDLFVLALTECLAGLEPSDRARLEFYYVQQMKLAAIGKKVGEHESTVSRNLERVRGELRIAIENKLRNAASLSEAEILLCVQYAATDAPIDFRKLFPEKDAGTTSEQRKEQL